MEIDRRRLLATMGCMGFTSLSGCSLIKPEGNVLLRVFNHRDNAVDIEIEILDGSDTVFIQKLSVLSNEDDFPGSMTKYALEEVNNGTDYKVNVTIDSSSEYQSQYTMQCAGDQEVQDELIITVQESDVRISQNEC